ncbi:hypothetical protein SARC_06819 [Sphaeroforma arctica JP610]|uniref:Uncharacterized protein n=1 Tax=Sphaeroforma arctica JP610 TaxID=667725 RepID=A0A0L0FVH1_9EUKA|nr:hypothetical protein SARC_06819 [Sphaeroforma arctica JP610]KNC80837.1 hypothetical protein SARC_06819 [Sphaeroforma arctica JP610]|eukprot:XP_014154739.1 hypothetical protein SARC_06819 [Sphaeroforma arctica JP610]
MTPSSSRVAFTNFCAHEEIIPHLVTVDRLQGSEHETPNTRLYQGPQLPMLEDRVALMLESKAGASGMVALDFSKAMARYELAS